MSTVPHRPIERIMPDLDAFLNLLNVGITCERLEVAGSVRRKCPTVGDVDIVAIPKFGEMDTNAGGMFPDLKTVNLLWHRVDDLVKLGTFAKHIKETAAGPRTKWGETIRAIEFRGMAFEVTCCDAANWFARLAIATGPGIMSKEIVTRLPQRGYRFTDDHQFHLEHRDGVHAPTPVIPASEREVFDLAGIGYKLPHQR